MTLDALRAAVEELEKRISPFIADAPFVLAAYRAAVVALRDAENAEALVDLSSEAGGSIAKGIERAARFLLERGSEG